MTRLIDNPCPTCQTIRPHQIRAEDPGSCYCAACGHQQVLMTPVGAE